MFISNQARGYHYVRRFSIVEYNQTLSVFETLAILLQNAVYSTVRLTVDEKPLPTSPRTKTESPPTMLTQSRFAIRSILAAALVVLTSTGSRSTCAACTVVRYSFDGHLIVARNHDWPFGEGALVVNQRGIKKTSLSPFNPATWVSKYGSVSLVQFGREIPFAGMNEHGLTVDLLELIDAKFPSPTADMSTVNVVQWVQYQLDTATTVKEVIASLENVVPVPMLPAIERVHYFITDASGGVAVIEFLDGRAVVQHGTEVAQCALSNSTWPESSAALDGEQPGNTSEQRYIQAVQSISEVSKNSSPDQRIDFALSTLGRVAQPGLTQWQLVYEPSERKLWFSTTKTPLRRWIDLDDLSFEPTTPTMILDLDKRFTGDATAHLQEYSDKDNKQIVDFAFGRLMPEGIARTAIKQLVINYAKSLQIAEQEAIPISSE